MNFYYWPDWLPRSFWIFKTIPKIFVLSLRKLHVCAYKIAQTPKFLSQDSNLAKTSLKQVQVVFHLKSVWHVKEYILLWKWCDYWFQLKKRGARAKTKPVHVIYSIHLISSHFALVVCFKVYPNVFVCLFMCACACACVCKEYTAVEYLWPICLRLCIWLPNSFFFAPNTNATDDKF